MQSIELRYGMNPNQKPASASATGSKLPFTVLNGAPGYINLLDALNAWQLVRELKDAIGLPAAASFKHVSPAGAAVAVEMNGATRAANFVADMELSPIASAYARARGADRVSSFGDFVAVSGTLDVATARLIRREVSDGIAAPGFEPEALEILKEKQNGRYLVLEMDPSYEPRDVEEREVFGVTLAQSHNSLRITRADLGKVVAGNASIPDGATRDLLVALIALKFTQSNSICLAVDGQVVGVGAGQQSRVHCARLAAAKADTWYLRQHPSTLGLNFADGLRRPERDNAIDGYLRDDLAPAEQRFWEQAFSETPTRLSKDERRAWLDGLSGVALASDGFIPFRDTVDRVSQSGVGYIAQPGGSLRDDLVNAACEEYGIVMAHTGIRLFHH